MNSDNKILLNGKWQLYYHPETGDAPATPAALSGYSEALAAQVPGNVELDLIRAGKLPPEEELYYADNILKLLDFEHYQWWYVKEFVTPDFEPDELIFEGLDCLTEIFLNGRMIGSTDNAMIPHTFKIKLNPAGQNNQLAVRIKSAGLWARECDRAGCLYGIPQNFDSLHIRKPAHAFGKDINPRVLSAGIWKSVILRKTPDTEIINPALYATGLNPDGSIGLRAIAEFRTQRVDISGFSAEITGICGQSKFQYRIERIVNKMIDTMIFRFDDPVLWWPKGYGKQPLYEVAIRLFDHGELIAEKLFFSGIRHVKLEYEAFNTAEHPGKFQLLINGRKIFAKGTNWIWMNLFHSRDPELIDDRLKLLDETGCNMLRMHGSNVYEDHRIYDFCDRKGIMIWQDFGMTGMGYPFVSDLLMKNMQKEFSWFITEYARHTSITVWSGDNEADVARCCWLAMEPVDPQSNKITRELLPALITTLDMNSRPFLPSSPYIDAYAHRRKQQENITVYDGLSDQHIYSEKFYKDPYYLDNIACFSSEIGFWSLSSPELIRQIIPPEELDSPRGNRYWNMHGTASLPVRKGGTIRAIHSSLNLINECFGFEPEDLESKCRASQIAQAEALKFIMENYRMRKPQCSGLIWWNLFDCWPQCASCAVTDNHLTPKISWYVLKRLHDKLLFFIDEELNIVASNDSFESFSGKLIIKQYSKPEENTEINYDVPPDCVIRIGRVDRPDHPELFTLFWDGGCNHYHCETRPFNLENYQKNFLPQILNLENISPFKTR